MDCLYPVRQEWYADSYISLDQRCRLLKPIHIKKGLDLPITGAPQQIIEEKSVSRVAVLEPDYIGTRLSPQVKVGDQVKLGQTLLCDKKNPEIRFVSPAGGVVDAIHRGERRKLLSVVIRVADVEEVVSFTTYGVGELPNLSAQQVRENLLNSGLWTAFRTRPFSKVPAPTTTPHSIFINAMDTNPLAPEPGIVINERGVDFEQGIHVLARLGANKIFVCKEKGNNIPSPELDQVVVREFHGPHPAGLVGTHIHLLDPVSADKTVWTIAYQDVMAVGRLFTTGNLMVERVIALAGPQVQRPRLIRTRLGAAIDELVVSELKPGENRIVSGSVLNGQPAIGELGFLGRYHQQVSVIKEEREKVFLGWLTPGKEKFSIFNLFSSKLRRGKKFNFSTTTNGEPRAMVPVGSYEAVMPLDILPTQLLRALIVNDTDTAQALGCLELDEEDLALCTYVCPGKYDYGRLLRECLDQIEKEV